MTPIMVNAPLRYRVVFDVCTNQIPDVAKCASTYCRNSRRNACHRDGISGEPVAG